MSLLLAKPLKEMLSLYENPNHTPDTFIIFDIKDIPGVQYQQMYCLIKFITDCLGKYVYSASISPTYPETLVAVNSIIEEGSCFDS